MISKAIQVLKAKRIFTDVAREVQATKFLAWGSAGPGSSSVVSLTQGNLVLFRGIWQLKK
jgi:hypothetical protein